MAWHDGCKKLPKFTTEESIQTSLQSIQIDKYETYMGLIELFGNLTDE